MSSGARERCGTTAMRVSIPRGEELLGIGDISYDLAPVDRPWVLDADEGGLAGPGYFVAERNAGASPGVVKG
jgi:hypothetical protein